ncbi:hypothetical protein ACP70R_005502 [Stipagrostis hirtigluma subsp. patula]
MRDNDFGGLGSMMNVFLFAVLLGSLALPAHCRPQLLDTGSTMATAVNSTSLDESKINLVLCVRGLCNYFNPNYQPCYCCGDGTRKENCHRTSEECKAKCPVCSPTCPLPPSVRPRGGRR